MSATITTPASPYPQRGTEDLTRLIDWAHMTLGEDVYRWLDSDPLAHDRAPQRVRDAYRLVAERRAEKSAVIAQEAGRS